jgi:hypothetical protein
LQFGQTGRTFGVPPETRVYSGRFPNRHHCASG